MNTRIRISVAALLCLCMLFSTACTASNEPHRDKSLLCSSNICDDETYLYFVRDREVLKIDKSTFAVSETGLSAKYIQVYDGDLYRTYHGTFYRGDIVVNLPEAPSYDIFVVDAFGCWITGSMFNVSYFCSDPVELRYWRKTENTFPVIDNKGKAHFCEEKPVGDYYYQVIDGVTVHRTHAGFMAFNGQFHIYNNHVYFAADRLLNIVSLLDGSRKQRTYDVTSVLAVGHNTVYFLTGDHREGYRLMKEDLSSGKLMGCPYPLSNTAECYVDSYSDVVYIIESTEEVFACSIAAFNEVPSEETAAPAD